MRQKLITLCPTSFEYALRKDNFSEWVRSKLIAEAKSNEQPWKYCHSCVNSMRTNQTLCINRDCNGYMSTVLEELE